LETPLQIAQDRRNGSHGHFAAVIVEDLDETTHVSALEVVREVDRHRERRNGLLLLKR
jgi:hypothetical protein